MGSFITKWGSSGSGDGQFIYPHGVAVDNLNNVLVADWGNNRIQKFDNTGEYLMQWGGFSDGQMAMPFDVATDYEGNIYVVDGNCRVQKFSRTGTYLTKWGSSGEGAGKFHHPQADL